MNTDRFVLCAFAVLCGILSLSSQGALANDSVTNNSSKNYAFRPLINTHEWRPKQEAMHFTITPPPVEAPLFNMVSTSNSPHADNVGNSQSSGFAKSKKDKEEWEDKILAMLPQGDRLKHMWEVVDGDVNLYFKGLRFDRGNKGVTYKTKTLPLIGEMDNTELKFEAGEDNKLSFKSSTVPFIGDIEGLSFRGSTGNKGSRISARYTISLD